MVVGETWIVAQIRAIDQGAEGAQYRSDSRNTNWMWRPSLVRKAPISGLTIGPRPNGALGCWPCSAERRSDDNVHIAVPSSETSTTEPSSCARSLEQGAGDAEGKGHAGVAIAHRAPLGDRVVALRRCEHVGHATAGEECRGVVAGHAGVGATHAVTVAAGVDQRRIPVAQLIGVEAEAPQCVRPKAGQEHVSGREQFVEQALPALGLDVDSDRPLAAVRQGDRQVDSPAVGADPCVARPR